MVGYNFEKKKRAKAFARKRRKQGYECSVYKKDGGYGVSSTRK